MPPGAEVVSVEISAENGAESGEHPWAWFAGIAKDNPLYDAFLEQMEVNRQKDEDGTRNYDSFGLQAI